jgi:hypothetical protein
LRRKIAPLLICQFFKLHSEASRFQPQIAIDGKKRSLSGQISFETSSRIENFEWCLTYKRWNLLRCVLWAKILST